MFWIVFLGFSIAAVIAATAVAPWGAILVAALGGLITTMVGRRYHQLVAAVEQADR
jgi:uncharacterized membrane protein YoaK (UPF0700 family)